MSKKFTYAFIAAVALTSLPSEVSAQTAAVRGAHNAPLVSETVHRTFRPLPVMTRDNRSIPVSSPADYQAAARKLQSSLPAKAAGASVPVYAVCLSSNQWPSYNGAVGVYKLPTDLVPDKLEAEFTDSRLYANAGAVYAGDKLYATNYLVYDYSTILPLTYSFNTEDWSYAGQIDGDITSMSTAMAYDEDSGNIYGCFYTDMGTQMKFGVFNPATGRSSTIKVLSKTWNACAVSPKGVLYAIDMNGDLSTVDKQTGNMTLVGNTGLKPAYLSGATFDPYSGKLYYVCTPQVDHSSLYEIDPATAQPTLLYALPGGEQVAGLFVPALTSSIDAPAAPTGLALSFEGPSLTGKISFTAPSQTFGGDALSGQLTYIVRVDGIDFTEGTVQPGATATAGVTVDKSGTHEFTVVLKNGSGLGAKAKISAFVGTDTAPAVQNVTLTVTDGKATLTWDPITQGVNGGYINADDVAYTVVRYPDAVTVASAVKATSFTETLPVENGVKAFYYTVYATVDGQDTAPVESNRYVTGAIQPPYSQSFDFGKTADMDVINTYTVIDANKDSKTWKYYYMAGFDDGRMSVTYNSKLAMDDWLITPPVYLEANKQYEFSLQAGGYSDSNTERFEVFYGKSATVEGMTDRLIDPTEVKTNTKDKEKSNKFFIPGETGIYYFGIHGISDANQFYLFIDDIYISAPKSKETPGPVTALSVTPDAGGELKAAINCIAPTKSAAGTDLTELTKIEILRDGNVITTLSDARPGMAVAYVDESVRSTGRHTYSVIAYNAEGQGNAVETTVYIGINKPAALVSLKLEETANTGEIKLSWTPSETDVDGYPLNPDLIRYTILSTDRAGEIIELETDYDGTEYLYQAVGPNETQRFISFAVIPHTRAGNASVSQTDVIAVGPAYTMPFFESFAEHTTDNAFGSNNYDEEEYSSWGYYADNSFDDSGLSYSLTSMDLDNGFVGYTAKAIGAHSGFRMGRVAVNTQVSPVFTFGHFVTNEADDNLIEVIAFFNDGTSKTLASFPANQNPGLVGTWETVTVPLDACAGKEAMLEIDVTCTGYAREFFDCFRIYNVMDHNLRAVAVEGSAYQNIGTNKAFDVVVENYGSKSAEGYTVELLRDGISAGSVAGKTLAPGETAKYTFRQDFSIIDPEEIVLTGVVNYSKDGFTDDNTTPEFTVSILKPAYPTATGLNAYNATDGIHLHWTAPADIFTTPVAVTEDFEGFDAWEYRNLAPWTLYDGDGYTNAAFESFVPPFGYTQTSFFVVDNTDTSVIPAEYRQGFSAYSGKKFMSNLPPRGDQGSIVNDWLISPELTGQQQTVSFYARSYHNSSLETFEVLYSLSDDPEPASFTLLDRYAGVPNQWTEITADMPKDAKYFAIRCVSNNKYMLFIDNVTMITKDGPVDMARLAGFNVYRNGVKVNSTTATGSSYHDAEAPAGTHTYFVTAVYDKGESVPSESIDMDTASVTDALLQSLRVTVEGHTILVTGIEGRNAGIFATDGRPVSTSQSGAALSATVAPGVYFVAAGSETVKVIVR